MFRMTLKEKLETLIANATNSVENEYHKDFMKLAMESPENFQVALAVKEQWNEEQPKIVLSSEYKRRLYQKSILGCTLPWIADSNIKFLRTEKRGTHNWGESLTLLNGKFFDIAIYDVDGTEKACTNWDKKTMKPIPIGTTYEKET